MRYLIRLSYDGSKFYGFQRQKDYITVQKILEDFLSSEFNHDILIKGAGRTDRGVHAKMQCAHFDYDIKFNRKQLMDKFNLNNSFVKILSIKKVDDNFHARFSVKKKHYFYRITFDLTKRNSEYETYYKKLDISKMVHASRLFLGVHNFQNFVSGIRDNYDCIVYKIKFKKYKNSVVIHFYGKSFYRYMVRNLVGALVDVGKGKASDEDIIRLLNSPKTDHTLSTAPAKGLTLNKIYY